MAKKRIFSGVKPSGDLHLGVYLGAIKSWVEMQEKYDSFFCIVDLHAITVPQDVEKLKERTLQLAKMYIACGIDPQKSTLFVQSQVKEHSELAWILNCYTQMGELEKMTQYKEKAGSGKQRASVGLFDYPVLMAADILLYNTEMVPVGEDQIQHVELCRNVAQRFNNRYKKDVFVLPEYFVPETGARVKGLQNPEKKMSKSGDNKNDCLYLLDDIDEAKKKIMKAVTDTDGIVKMDIEKKPGISNLISIYANLSGESVEDIEKKYKGKGYGDFKKDLAEIVGKFLSKVQEKYNSISDEEILRILSEGAEKMCLIAAKKIQEVKNVVGFLSKGY